jgi:hypothetical protein
VIISWWSNCLALASLHAMYAHGIQRRVCVVQVGKSPQQCERFRQFVPPGVVELPYPATAPGEHSRVIHEIALRQLRDTWGIWFVDHDVFAHAALEPWFECMDAWSGARSACLGLSPTRRGAAATSPAFWMSPRRWPATAPSLDPVPFDTHSSARRPDLHAVSGGLRMPQKDTLIAAWEYLEPRHQGDRWPAEFPPHTHLGGLSLFTSSQLPFVDEWTRATVRRFGEFFASCPLEWLQIEDSTLLRRCEEFTNALA